MKLYKCTLANGKPLPFGQPLELPAEDSCGPWTPPVDASVTVAGRVGHTVSRLDRLPINLGPVIFEARIHPDAEVVDYGGTIIASSIRLTRRIEAWDADTATQFAAECLDHVLPWVSREWRLVVTGLIRAALAATRGFTACPTLFHQARDREHEAQGLDRRILHAGAAAIGIASGGCDDDSHYVPWRTPGMIVSALSMYGDGLGVTQQEELSWQATRLSEYLGHNPPPSSIPNSTPHPAFAL